MGTVTRAAKRQYFPFFACEIFHSRLGRDEKETRVEVTNRHEVSGIVDEAPLHRDSHKVLLHSRMAWKQSSGACDELKWGLAPALIVISRQKAWMLMSRVHRLPTAAPRRLPDISPQLSLPDRRFATFKRESSPFDEREGEKKCKSKKCREWMSD